MPLLCGRTQVRSLYATTCGFPLHAPRHRFTDKQVLSASFKDELANVAKIMRPFVHWCVVFGPGQGTRSMFLLHSLNDMMTIPPDDDDEED